MHIPRDLGYAEPMLNRYSSIYTWVLAGISAKIRALAAIMIPPYFVGLEKTLVLKYLDEWQALKGTVKYRGEDGDLVHPKDELIDTIILDFFRTFPERDISKFPRSIVALPVEERDKLHGVSNPRLTI
jgi:hypothetical protein